MYGKIKFFENGKNLQYGKIFPAEKSFIKGKISLPFHRKNLILRFGKLKLKVVANLRKECKKYGKYSQEVGHCDCKQSGCQVTSIYRKLNVFLFFFQSFLGYPHFGGKI